MEFQHKQKGDHYIFQLIDKGEEAGYIQYKLQDDKVLIIEHTESHPAFAGQGVGKKLVKEMVKFARSEHKKIIAHCPFAKSVIEKDEDLKEILMPSE